MGFDLHQWIADVQKLDYFRRRVEIARRIHPSLSRFVYKYRAIDEGNPAAIDRLRDLLVRSRLWLSSPVDFNDPFDMSGSIVAKSTTQEKLERVNEMLKRHRLTYKERERKRKMLMRTPLDVLENELKAAFEKNMPTTGVFSFAGDPRNILMWSHYARDHTGICVQFERARDFGILCGALTVEYSVEYPEVNSIKDFQDFLSKMLLRKHEGWSYEREHRIVRPGEAHSYLRFDPQALVGIIFGCRSTAAGRRVIESLLEERDRAGMPRVCLLAAQKHRSKYRLVVSTAK